MKIILMISAAGAAYLYYVGSNGNYTSDVVGALQRGWTSLTAHAPCTGCTDAAGAARATDPATSTPITLGGM